MEVTPDEANQVLDAIGAGVAEGIPKHVKILHEAGYPLDDVLPTSISDAISVGVIYGVLIGLEYSPIGLEVMKNGDPESIGNIRANLRKLLTAMKVL